MKKNGWKIVTIAILSITVLAGCGSSEKKQEAPVEMIKEQYQCPMKCSGEVFDKPGSCNVCRMDLEKVAKG